MDKARKNSATSHEGLGTSCAENEGWMMVDIHTHMIYGIDDGAVSREMSLTLMGIDYEQGVRDIFCTNHSYGMEDRYGDYHERFEDLRDAAREAYPGLTLYKGCEVLCHRDDMAEIVSNIKRDVYPTLNGTKYVLMEFDPDWKDWTDESDGMEEMTYCLKYALDAGFIPVVAHVERYANIYNDPLSDMQKIKELGCMAQINLFSVAQDRGYNRRRELANLYLTHGLVDFVGTDAHRLNYKSPEAAIGAAAIREKYGDSYADEILFGNAKKHLIGGEDA